MDGLDEICDLDRRRAICLWIDRIATGLTKARFVVTSRWTGYRKAEGIELGSDHIRADVKDFSGPQQEEFLRKWFKAAYANEQPPESADAGQWHTQHEALGNQRAQDIIEFLAKKENKAVQELAGVPMLLQIIAILWKERGVRLNVRSDLYQAAMKYLLDFRDRKRDLIPLMSANDALRVLCPVAWWMQETLHADAVSKAGVYEQMQPIIKTIDSSLTSERFYENLRDRAGLIADYGPEACIFRHKSFREYLAGVQLNEQAKRDPKTVNRLIECLGDDWWEETLRFFMAEVDDQVFDGFMDALFTSDVSGDLDPKQQSLLRALIGDARQKRIDSLVRCLNDRRISDNKKWCILDCLKTIGTPETLETVRQYQEQAVSGLLAEVVEEVLAASEAGRVSARKVRTPPDIFRDLPRSFRNPYELNAEYILIPGGSFAYSVDKKTRQVPDLYFAKYPVTNKRHRRFIAFLEGEGEELSTILTLDTFLGHLLEYAPQWRGWSEYTKDDQLNSLFRSKYNDDKQYKGDDQPVVGITWYAARVYCVWLSELEMATKGRNLESTIKYQLPQEFECEWAAGGGKREYPWSPEKGGPNPKLANYITNVGTTTPVGQYPDGATPEGLMDMAGNVWEWMENRYQEDNPIISLRGGSWVSGAENLRCSARY